MKRVYAKGKTSTMQPLKNNYLHMKKTPLFIFAFACINRLSAETKLPRNY